MTLRTYHSKRKFKNTPEPKGGTSGKKNDTLSFVVQRHKASSLHYDFRLEADGVLKSWAVPKGPSMNPADKRLAMKVEDHPLEYRNFSGIIPEGNYGAGIVEIWDHGTYRLIDADSKEDAAKLMKRMLQKGDVKVDLKGRKLKGEFALVRMKSAGKNAWLLIKHRDKYAVNKSYNSEEQTPKSSPINRWLKKHAAKSGRSAKS